MNNISELLQRDPASMNEADIKEIIAFYRNKREEFAAAAKQPKAPKPVAVKDRKKEIDLELDL